MTVYVVKHDEDDDLFARPPRSAMRRQAQPPIDRTAQRRCRYCQASYTVTIDYDGPPLCPHCAANVPAVRAAIKRDLTSVLAQMDAANQAFDAVKDQHPAEWSKLEQALAARADGRTTEAQLAARWAARMQDPNPAWPELLRAYEQREVDLAPLAAERRRLEEAERAIQ